MKTPKSSSKKSLASKKKSTKKQVSLSQIVSKLAGILANNDEEDEKKKSTKKKRRPFQKSEKTKQAELKQKAKEKKRAEEELEKKIIDEEIAEAKETGNVEAIESMSTTREASAEHPATSFFYSDEKFVTAFEDDEIIAFIQKKYPMFKKCDDAIMKKTVINILNDSDFMEELLNHYNLSIYDFFKFMYRVEPSIFKGLFIKRVQKALGRKKYARVKLPNYKFRKVQAAINRRKKLAKKAKQC